MWSDRRGTFRAGFGLALATSIGIAACFPSLDELRRGDGDPDATTPQDSSVLDGGNDTGTDGPTTCGDTQTDRRNCGVCGHDCLGGGCIAGKCQPIIVAENEATFLTPLPVAARAGARLAADDTTLYWIAAETIRRFTIGTSTAPQSLAGASIINSLAVDGTGVYAGTRTGDVVRYEKADGGRTVLISEPSALVEYVATTPTGVAYAGEENVRSVAKPSSTHTQQTFTRTSPPAIACVATNGETIFFVLSQSGGQLRTVTVAGSDLAASGPIEGRVCPAATSSAVAWVNPTDKSVVVLENGASTILAAGQIDNASGLAIDATHVYVALGRGSGNAKIARVLRSDPKSFEILADAQNGAHDVAVSSNAIAWMTNGGDGGLRNVVLLAK